MDLSIIIVNWNVRDLLEKCLASVYRETRNLDFEVIVVDNASSDGSDKMVKEKFPQVRLIANKENRWFAGGNNQGFAAARGDLILLLNPDTEILDGAIEKMAGIMGGDKFQISNPFDKLRACPEHAEGTSFKFQKNNQISNFKFKKEEKEIKRLGIKEIVEKIPLNPHLEKGDIPNIGVIGCKLLNSDMSLQPSCRRLPSLFDQILIFLKLHNFFPRLKPVRDYYMSDFDYDSEREVEQVMGACLLTRKEIIDKIGGLDERYGAIFEEVDFCKRVADHGWKIYFTPKARIIHHKGQSFRQRRIITNQKNFNYALLRYFKKHKSFWQYLIILVLWPVSMFLAVIDQLMIVLGIRGFKARFKKRDY